MRWRKWLVLTVLVRVGGFIAIRISDEVWSDWKRASAARTANREFDQFQSGIKSIALPEGELAWSNDPADLTTENLANSQYFVVNRILMRSPPPELDDYQLLHMMPLTVRRVSGMRSNASGPDHSSSWYAAITVDFRLYPALGNCSGNSTSFWRIPPPLDTAKTFRFWVPTETAEGQDVAIPVEADGVRYRLIISAQDNQLRVEKTDR